MRVLYRTEALAAASLARRAFPKPVIGFFDLVSSFSFSSSRSSSFTAHSGNTGGPVMDSRNDMEAVRVSSTSSPLNRASSASKDAMCARHELSPTCGDPNGDESISLLSFFNPDAPASRFTRLASSYAARRAPRAAATAAASANTTLLPSRSATKSSSLAGSIASSSFGVISEFMESFLNCFLWTERNAACFSHSCFSRQSDE